MRMGDIIEQEEGFSEVRSPPSLLKLPTLI